MNISLNFGTFHQQVIFIKKMRFKTLLTSWWHYISNTLRNEKLRRFITYFGVATLLLLLLMCSGCAAHKKITYVPTQTIHKVEYRDSVVRVKDTVYIELPVERIVEVIPELDTLKMETSVAEATAYLDIDRKQLRGELRNKKTQLPAKVDTLVVFKNKIEYLEKPVIQKVETPVPYIPKFAWICIVYTCTSVLVLLILGFLKLKKII